MKFCGFIRGSGRLPGVTDPARDTRELIKDLRGASGFLGGYVQKTGWREASCQITGNENREE